MLSILVKNKPLAEVPKIKEFNKSSFEITVYRLKTVTTSDKQGNLIIKNSKTPVNLSRRINETAKLVKQDLATKKLEQISNLINKQ